MNKEKIAENILARAKSTLYFLEHALTFGGMKANDIVWQRSILIMLSYAFELVLKAKIVLSSKSDNKDSINKELIGLGHNIQKILCDLDKRDLISELDIKSYKVISNDKFKRYEIEFKDGIKIVVEDFVDIRYDYVKSDLRNVINHDVIVGYISKILNLSIAIQKDIHSSNL